MSKSKKSIYNALSSIVFTFLNGLFGIVLMKSIIEVYGSDFNGLNSTVNQFINMLLVIEGGFTLAINVALFKYLSQKDYNTVNSILAASKNIFRKIGILFLVLGFLGSILSCILIKTNVDLLIVFFSFFSMVIATSFNLVFSTKYRILLQTDQKEYIINIIQIITLLISQTLLIISIKIDSGMISIRLLIMLFNIVSSIIIIIYAKRNYRFIDMTIKPNKNLIKGTNDIFIQKITSVFYGAFPMIFISSTSGTTVASVYIVYNSIFTLIKSLIYSVVNAPRIGFGKLIVEREKSYVLKIFTLYEFIIINIILLALLSLNLLITPFINLYISGIKDISYQNTFLVVVMMFIMFFEMIHIPSGNILNMGGMFKIGKKIQTITAIILVISMIVLNLFFGFMGTLVGVLFAAVILAILEIYYVHFFYFEEKLGDLIKIYIPLFIFFVLNLILQYKYIIIKPTSYVHLLFLSILVFIGNIIVLSLFNYIFNKRLCFEFVQFVKKVVYR